jgi:hypothetical protein
MGAANPASPQSWNRYAYVLNGPLNSVDPLGLHEINDCLGCVDDDFGNPNATTYTVNGVQVAPIFAQNILGTGSGGYNSFSSSSFFFNSGQMMSSSNWALSSGGNIWAEIQAGAFVGGNSGNCTGDCSGTFVPIWVNLGSAGTVTVSSAANNGPQQPQQPQKPQQPTKPTLKQNFCFYTSPAGLGGILSGVGLGMGSISWGGTLTTLGLSGAEVGSFAVGAATVGPYLAVGGAVLLVTRGAIC